MKIILSIFSAVLLASALLLPLSPALAQSPETMNLTTYYPAPLGNYSKLNVGQLRLVPRLGPISAAATECTATTEGLIVYSRPDRDSYMCAPDPTAAAGFAWRPFGSGFWTKSGNNLYPTEYTNPDLKVGIGTNLPGTPLDVLTTANNEAFRSTNALIGDGIAVAGDFNAYGGTSGDRYGIMTNASAGNGNSFGIESSAHGSSGIAYGVRSVVNGAAVDDKYGVYSTVTGAGTKYGLYGKADGDDTDTSTKYGLRASGAGNSNSSKYGVYAVGSGNGGLNFGVRGMSSGSGTTNYGLYGSASGATTRNYGIRTIASGGAGTTNFGVDTFVSGGAGSTNYGIYALASGGTSYAGYFDGNLATNGYLAIENNAPLMYLWDKDSGSAYERLWMTATDGVITFQAEDRETGQWRTLLGLYVVPQKVRIPVDLEVVGKIKGGDPAGAPPFITGWIQGDVGTDAGDPHVVGSLPAGYTGSRCITFLQGFKDEHCPTWFSCSASDNGYPVALAVCEVRAGDTAIYGSLHGDTVAAVDGSIRCGYLCW